VFNILWEFTVYRITCNAKNQTHVRSHSLSLVFVLYCRKVNERNGF